VRVDLLWRMRERDIVSAAESVAATELSLFLLFFWWGVMSESLDESLSDADS
jgi:hypothetical protein